jgi:hypothetical protein
MRWIRGERLQIIFDLKGMSAGDELDCQCGGIHTFLRWQGELIRLRLGSPGSPEETIRPIEIRGWRPKR